jgi:glycosyltransferase involved in cell wall biosynthesis
MQPRPPLVSIGVPVHNGERFLRRALDSLVSQSFQDWEAIVSDNRSTDGTWAICEEYQARDPRIRLLRQTTNIGAAANFNAVLQAARGSYFKWAAADDELHPEFLQACLAVLEREPTLDLVHARALLIDEDGGVQAPVNSHGLTLCSTDAVGRCANLLRVCNIDSQVVMQLVMGLFRRSALLRLPPIGNYYGADLTLVFEAVLRGRVGEVDQVLLCFRRHGASSSYRRVPRAAEQQRFYDPRVANRIAVQLQFRRRYWELARAAWTSELSLRRRLTLLRLVGGHTVARFTGKIRFVASRALPARAATPSR